jgi:hypothetical protein
VVKVTDDDVSLTVSDGTKIVSVFLLGVSDFHYTFHSKQSYVHLAVIVQSCLDLS